MRTVLPTCSTTTIFSLRDYHDLKINGYRRSLDTDSCRLFFSSLPFRAGGRKWHIVYRPKGNDGNSDYISFFLALDDIIDQGGVLAKFTFSLLDQDKNPVPCYCITSRTCHFSVPGRMIRFKEFIKRETLEAPEGRLLHPQGLDTRCQGNTIYPGATI
jgi:speckle-type POZ protein